MGEVINLRRARKAKERRAREQDAAEARLLHGRTRSERSIAQADIDRATRFLDQSRLQPRTKDE